MPFKTTSKIINNISVTSSVNNTDHGELQGLLDNDHPIYTLTSSFLPVSTSHALVSGSHVLVSSAFETHRQDSTIHFTEASIDHTAIQNVGTNTHAQIDSHISDGTIHFTEASIDHTAITNVGTNTHAQIDTHIADNTIHFESGSIPHGDLQDVGTNTHAQIDTHIANDLIHFVSGDIVHNDLSGLTTGDPHQQYILVDGSRAFTGDVDFGNNNLSNINELTGSSLRATTVIDTPRLDINGAWELTSETEGGTERLLLTGIGASASSEFFLQSKGSADEARITLSPDENTNNYGGVEFEARNAANSINVIQAGSGDIRPFRLGITGSAIMVMATDGDITFQTGSVRVEESMWATRITGSHTEVTSGTPYLLGEGTVTITTAANGQITISGSGDGGGAGGTGGLDQFQVVMTVDVFS